MAVPRVRAPNPRRVVARPEAGRAHAGAAPRSHPGGGLRPGAGHSGGTGTDPTDPRPQRHPALRRGRAHRGAPELGSVALRFPESADPRLRAVARHAEVVPGAGGRRSRHAEPDHRRRPGRSGARLGDDRVGLRRGAHEAAPGPHAQSLGRARGRPAGGGSGLRRVERPLRRRPRHRGADGPGGSRSARGGGGHAPGLPLPLPGPPLDSLPAPRSGLRMGPGTQLLGLRPARRRRVHGAGPGRAFHRGPARGGGPSTEPRAPARRGAPPGLGAHRTPRGVHPGPPGADRGLAAPGRGVRERGHAHARPHRHPLQRDRHPQRPGGLAGSRGRPALRGGVRADPGGGGGGTRHRHRRGRAPPSPHQRHALLVRSGRGSRNRRGGRGAGHLQRGPGRRRPGAQGHGPQRAAQSPARYRRRVGTSFRGTLHPAHRGRGGDLGGISVAGGRLWRRRPAEPGRRGAGGSGQPIPHGPPLHRRGPRLAGRAGSRSRRAPRPLRRAPGGAGAASVGGARRGGRGLRRRIARYQPPSPAHRGAGRDRRPPAASRITWSAGPRSTPGSSRASGSRSSPGVPSIPATSSTHAAPSSSTSRSSTTSCMGATRWVAGFAMSAAPIRNHDPGTRSSASSPTWA